MQKIRVPGMLHGKVVRPQTLGAHFVSMDLTSLNGLPGNPVAVQFVAQYSEREWEYGAAGPLRHAAGQHDRQRRCQRTYDGASAQCRQDNPQHAVLAEDVTQSAENRSEHGSRQQVDRQNPSAS